ncbi:MAG: macro domain-containing protein [Acidimicrobiales bacterium]
MSDRPGTVLTVASFDGVRVEITKGDITAQPDLDAIVNAANASLAPGAGVAGAIHRAAGPGLAEECRPLAPIGHGECVITSGQRLENPYVIHCLGPVYGVDDDPSDRLSSCYRWALDLAESRQLRSIGFPAISTGVFGYPLDAAADVAIATIASAAPLLSHVRLVRLVLFDDAAYSAFARALRKSEHDHLDERD